MNRSIGRLLLVGPLLLGLLVLGCGSDVECEKDSDCEQNEAGEQIEICKFHTCVSTSCEGDPEQGWRLISNTNLRNVVREMVGLTTDEEYLFFRHVRKIEKLEAVNLNIGGINGLQCFVSLKRLYLDNNNISNLSPLTQHPRLQVLSIGRNGVSNLSPLSEVFTLEELLIADNNVSNLGPLLRVPVDPEDPEKGYRPTRLNLINLADNITDDGRDNRISDLTPLVENSGIGNGDQINLTGNSLNCEATCPTTPCDEEQGCGGGCVCQGGQCLTHVQALRARGTFVLTDCDE